MVFEIIITVLLILFFTIPFTSELRKSDKARKMMMLPMVALAIFWTHRLAFVYPGNTGALSSILNVIFYFLFVLSIIMFILLLLLIKIDKEKHIGPIIAGNPKGSKLMYIIFHTGIIGKTPTIMEQFASYFKDSDYRIEINSISKDLNIDNSKADIIVINSPLYMGDIRPPIKRFIEKYGWENQNTIVLLTGGTADTAENDTQNVVNMIIEKGGKVIGQTKILLGDSEKITKSPDQQIKEFAEKIKSEI